MISANISADIMNILSAAKPDQVKKDVSYMKDTTSQKGDFKSALEKANSKIENDKTRPKVNRYERQDARKNSENKNNINTSVNGNSNTEINKNTNAASKKDDTAKVQSNNADSNEVKIQNNDESTTVPVNNVDNSKDMIKVDIKVKSSQEPIDITQLSEEDKKFVKDLANLLNIDNESLMNLLQTFNINLNSLDKTDITKAAEQLKGFVEDLASKISLKLNIKTDELSLKEKVHLMVKLKSKDADKSDENSQDISLKLNFKVDIKEKDVNDSKNTKDFNEKPAENGVVDTQAKLKVMIKQQDSVKENQPVSEVEGETQNIQTKAQTSSSGESKNSFTRLFENAKVINLKTSKENITEGARQDLFHILNTKTTIESVVSKEALQVLNNVKDNVFNQIVDTAKLTLTDNQTEMELTLKPENLGKLNLKIASENGLVVAKIVAENQQVKDIIESNLIQLKESLKEQGLNIQDVSVSVGNDRRQEFERGNFGQGRGTRRVNFDNNSVRVSENYTVKQQIISNPYLVSDSNFDYSA